MKDYLYNDINAAFPILKRWVNGKRLVYLDSAATSLKPAVVAETVANYYLQETSSVHRGAHYLSEEATARFERVRKQVAQFINAEKSSEIVFTSGTTLSINMVARSFAEKFLDEGDEIIVSEMEHHSNIVPWQMVCQAKKAKLKVIPVKDNGELDLNAFEKLITSRTKLVSVTHVSNVLGTINPIKQISALTKPKRIALLVDGAQAAPHLSINVQTLGCDFYAFSAHKVFGPTGLGVLYMTKAMQDALPPVIGGGNMIRSVSFSGTTYAEDNAKFEAGTPPIAQVLGLGAALEFVEKTDLGRMADYEHSIRSYAEAELSKIPGLTIYGKASEKAAVVSFTLAAAHPHDIGTILDSEGIAVRAGHHCCQPLMERFKVPAMTRASFSIYNSQEDVEALVKGIGKVQEIFR